MPLVIPDSRVPPDQPVRNYKFSVSTLTASGFIDCWPDGLQHGTLFSPGIFPGLILGLSGTEQAVQTVSDAC